MSKPTLKQAREFIDKKDYKEGTLFIIFASKNNLALKICKALLQDDKKNYTAWIFFGLASSQAAEFVQHAEPAYRKAIEIEPQNPLAWKVCRSRRLKYECQTVTFK
jgi:hypothetical protein